MGDALGLVASFFTVVLAAALGVAFGVAAEGLFSLPFVVCFLVGTLQPGRI